MDANLSLPAGMCRRTQAQRTRQQLSPGRLAQVSRPGSSRLSSLLLCSRHLLLVRGGWVVPQPQDNVVIVFPRSEANRWLRTVDDKFTGENSTTVAAVIPDLWTAVMRRRLRSALLRRKTHSTASINLERGIVIVLFCASPPKFMRRTRKA